MNFTLNNKKIWKIVFIMIVISFLWISTFGLLYHLDEMKLEGTKVNCLFSGQTEGCAMNFSEHITLWQGRIMTLPENTVSLIDALMLIILFAGTINFWQNYLFEFSQRISSRFKLYIKQHPQINLFNYLGEIFSRGILNTKIYETITI